MRSLFPVWRRGEGSNLRYSFDLSKPTDAVFDSQSGFTPPVPFDTVKANKQTITAVEKIIASKDFARYVMNRYRIDYAKYLLRNAKLVPLVLEDPTLLKQYSWRKANAILEAITPIRDYAEIIGLKLDIDTKLLRKHLPHKSIDEITNAILEYELAGDYEEKQKIIEQAVEYLKALPMGKYKLACLIDFYTGLRSTEIKFLFDNYDKLRKIHVTDNVTLIVLNYDRNKKKAYFTLVPRRLWKIMEHELPKPLAFWWNDHVREDYGVRVSVFRKAWVAITSPLLDSAEKDLLQGRLKRVLVEHYVRHIREIAERYYRSFERYLFLIELYEANAEQAFNRAE